MIYRSLTIATGAALGTMMAFTASAQTWEANPGLIHGGETTSVTLNAPATLSISDPAFFGGLIGGSFTIGYNQARLQFAGGSLNSFELGSVASQIIGAITPGSITWSFSLVSPFFGLPDPVDILSASFTAVPDIGAGGTGVTITGALEYAPQPIDLNAFQGPAPDFAVDANQFVELSLVALVRHDPAPEAPVPAPASALLLGAALAGLGLTRRKA